MNNKIYCFFGVDGAGKTTTIEGIKKRLESKGEKCIVMRMNRAGDNKLPFIQTMIKLRAKHLKRKKKNKNKEDGLALVDIYRKRSFIFLIVYYLDLLLRNREAKRLSKENVVLMDRYFYDGLALTNKRWLPLFSKLTPKPTKSFFIYAPPEVIWNRKKEATKQNMIDYKERVENDFTKYFNIVKIDTSKPLDEVLDKIESEIQNNGKSR